MSFLSAVIDKIKKLLDQGDLVTDLGTIAIDEIGREVSLSIRQCANRPPYLQIKLVWRHNGETFYLPIDCSIEWADYLEKVAREMRRQINAPAT
jgi:hypothetical protein